MMNPRAVLAVAGLALVAALPAQAQLPQTLDEMKAQHVLLGTTPEGAVTSFIEACFVYMNPATRDAGREMLQFLALPLQFDVEWDRMPSQRRFSEYLLDGDHHHVWRSYIKGSSPENGYRMNPDDWILSFARGDFEDKDRTATIDIYSSGADDPRPVHVKLDQESGLWYVADWDALLQEVRPPVPGR